MIFYGTDSILPLLKRADDLARELTHAEVRAAMEPMLWFVEHAAADPGIKLAPSGRLGRAILQAADARFDFTQHAQIDSKPQTQDDVPPVVELRVLTRNLGLARTYKGHLVATAKGKRLLDQADQPALLRETFRRACAHICPEDSFEGELTSLLLVLLIDAGPDGRDGMSLYDELGATLARRWDIPRVGTPPHDRWSVSCDASDARGKFDALQLLAPSDDFHLALNGTLGLTGAVLALHARLEAAVAAEHPSGRSPLVEWAVDHGFDPTNQASLDEAMRRFNSLPFDERGRILELD